MSTVTLAELGPNLGAIRERAMREPVFVEHEGDASIVIVSAQEFERLRSLDARRAYDAREWPDDVIEALEGATPGPGSLRHADG